MMSKKGIPLLFVIALLCLLVSSCADHDAVQTKDSVAPVSDDYEKLGEEIESSNEFRELIAIRDELASRAIARNVTAEQIREAGYDVERSNELLGLSETERRERFDRIEALINSLHARYPALREIEAREAVSFETCDIECAASRWERYAVALAGELSGDGTLALEAPARAPLRCKVPQLIFGFGVCALRSGGSALFYVVCSYGVFCASCDGGVADMIC